VNVTLLAHPKSSYGRLSIEKSVDSSSGECSANKQRDPAL